MPRQKKFHQPIDVKNNLSIRQKTYKDYLSRRLDEFISNNPEPSKAMQVYIDSLRWNIENVNKLFK